MITNFEHYLQEYNKSNFPQQMMQKFWILNLPQITKILLAKIR